MTTQQQIPKKLEEISAGRDYILTSEFAHVTTRAEQTIRKNYCLKGECFGLRPVKFGNRLLWSVSEIAALLNGGA
jgi:hypothetical protein